MATLPIVLEGLQADVVFDRIQSLSREYGLTPYDAAYLDLAKANGLPLATLDQDLIDACGSARVEIL
ncbi:MAG: type II toxin-antitoxin system VapC family toxin [Candidatus Sulfotelmatobacter sp.]